jgi:hypothetical protein
MTTLPHLFSQYCQHRHHTQTQITCRVTQDELLCTAINWSIKYQLDKFHWSVSLVMRLRDTGAFTGRTLLCFFHSSEDIPHSFLPPTPCSCCHTHNCSIDQMPRKQYQKRSRICRILVLGKVFILRQVGIRPAEKDAKSFTQCFTPPPRGISCASISLRNHLHEGLYFQFV